jgi:hypothetical protein
MNTRKLVDFRGSYHYCYQHGQLTRKPRSKYWFACFRDVNGKQRRRSTRQTDRKKALKVAEQFEQVGQRKLAPRTVRESLAELYLYREIYGETLPVATIRKFVADWGLPLFRCPKCGLRQFVSVLGKCTTFRCRRRVPSSSCNSALSPYRL